MRINKTSFGSITVDGRTHPYDIWIFADGSVRRRDRNHEFALEELRMLLNGDPEILIIGTGQAGCVRVHQAVVEEAHRRGVEILSAETPRAVREFNRAVRAGKRVAAAFHVTC